MPGFLGGNKAAAGAAPPPGGGFKNFAIQAAPLFSAMAAGYSSGRGPYAYLDQGIQGIQAAQKAKRDEEAAAAAAAAFGGLVPGGMGAAGGGMGARPSYGPLPPPPQANPNSPHALGDDTMAALGKPAVKTAADPASIKAGLVARGLPEHVADGFVMNFQDESGLNPGINEINPIVPGSRGGFGLYQLTGPRRKAYEAYASERGIPLDDVDAQLDFLMMELQGPESRAAQAILSTKDAGSAGAAIVNEFLRPAEEHRASRTARYTGGGAAPATPADPMADPYVQQMMQVMAMPGLTAEQRAVVEMQLQSRIQTITTPQPGAEENMERERRARDAELLGLQPGTAPFNQYVVTGQAPEPPKPIEVGGVLLDPNTYKPIFDSRKPPEPEAPTTKQVKLADGSDVMVQWNPETKVWDPAPVPAGGTTGTGQSAATVGQVYNPNEVASVVTMIDEILAEPNLDNVLGNKAVVFGGGNQIADMNMTQRLAYGQGGLGTIERIGQLQSNAWLSARQMLKGGGAITDYESRKAEAAVARLERAKEPAEFRQALQDLRDAITEGEAKLRGTGGGAAVAPITPPTGGNVTGSGVTWSVEP